MVRAGSARAGMGRGFARVPQSAKASAGWQRRLSALRHPSNIRLIVLVKCFLVACLQLVPGLIGSPQPSKHRQNGGARGCCASSKTMAQSALRLIITLARVPDQWWLHQPLSRLHLRRQGPGPMSKNVLEKHEGAKVGAVYVRTQFPLR